MRKNAIHIEYSVARRRSPVTVRGSGDVLASSPAAVYAAKIKAPFAVLGIRTARGAVTGVEYLTTRERSQSPTDAIAERACRQIERYLADPQWRFTLPLAPAGTAFRRKVWDALSKIPVGESRTYGEIARMLHTAPRAVGGACGANPIALEIGRAHV